MNGDRGALQRQVRLEVTFRVKARSEFKVWFRVRFNVRCKGRFTSSREARAGVST